MAWRHTLQTVGFGAFTGVAVEVKRKAPALLHSPGSGAFFHKWRDVETTRPDGVVRGPARRGETRHAVHRRLACRHRRECGDPKDLWMIPVIQTIHIICLAMVFSFVVMIELRVLGVTDPRRSKDMRIAMWRGYSTCVVIMVVTGSILIIGEPQRLAAELRVLR